VRALGENLAGDVMQIEQKRSIIPLRLKSNREAVADGHRPTSIFQETICGKDIVTCRR
jgi:hypothetical protein